MRAPHLPVVVLAALAVVAALAAGSPLSAQTPPHATPFTTIQGNALTSASGPLADAAVRLRDARIGRIVRLANTDRSGLFAFGAVEPGSYIVEVLGANQAVLAASAILNVNAGEVVSAVVKLPFRIQPFAGVLGHTAASAILVTSTAAATGVLATQVAGQDVSPRR